MDELIKQAGASLNLVSVTSLWDMIVVLVLSAILSVIVARTYTFTHSGVSYSSTFAQTIVFVGLTIALIMVIIGSNIARAFALVGAMSIVRFRNPVKDSRDIAFLFMTMAVGMAVGTGFYLFAVIFTGFGCFGAVLMQRLRFGELSRQAFVLRVRMGQETRDSVEAVLRDICSSFALVSIDRLGDEADYIYEVTLRRTSEYETLVNRLGAVDERISVTLLVGGGIIDA